MTGAFARRGGLFEDHLPEVKRAQLLSTDAMAECVRTVDSVAHASVSGADGLYAALVDNGANTPGENQRSGAACVAFLFGPYQSVC